MPYVVLGVRLFIGGLLIVAGALKVGHFSDVAAAIAGFRLLPAPITAPLAVALPFIEIFLGAYLVIGLFTRLAGWLSCAAFALYAGVIASAVLRHLPANCGCFGPADAATADWPHVLFDLALAALGALVALRAPGAFALDSSMKVAS